MSYQKGKMTYEGKAKRLYDVIGYPELIWQEFKDSLTAFNGVKKAEMANKGALNRNISTAIFKYFKKKGISSHWIESPGTCDMITEKLKMIPLEVVVRNKAAGSLVKRLGIAEKTIFPQPLVEFFFKSDALGDPFINDEQVLLLNALKTTDEVQKLKKMALTINQELTVFFNEIGLDLIDFKIEFGKRVDGTIVLSDEISPDSCRLWDIKSGERKDKDRFRMDLGNVIESYSDIWTRIQTHWGLL